MAISRLGSQYWNCAGATGSKTDVSVPANTDCVVAFCGAYGSGSPSFGDPVCTLGTQDFTQQAAKAVDESGSSNGICVETLVDLDGTGTLTLYYDWGFTPTADNREIGLVYFSGVDQTTPVADADTATTDTTITGLTTADWMIGGVSEYNQDSSVTGNSQTEVFVFQNTNGSLVSGEKSGAEDEFHSAADYWDGRAAVTLNEASAATPVSNPQACVFEALASTQVDSAPSFEALASINIQATNPMEAGASIITSRSPGFEALASVQAAQAPNFEALSRLAVAGVLTFECLGTAETGVSGVALIPIEALGGLNITTVLPFETLTDISAQAAPTLEALTSIDLAQPINFEALGLAVIEAPAAIAFEARGIVAAPIAVGIEALARRVQTQNPSLEALASTARAQAISFEALLQILEQGAIPFEADGGLLTLLTPYWRVMTVDYALRVITISAVDDPRILTPGAPAPD